MADWREIVPDAPLSQISQTVPNPGDVFTRREIAKANRDIQMLRRKARQLPKKHLKACEAWYENIRSELERAGYFRAIELRDRLHEEFVAERERSAQIRTRLEADTLDEVTRDDLLLDLDDLRQQSQAIWHRGRYTVRWLDAFRQRYGNTIRAYRRIEARLSEHYAAVRRAKVYRELMKGLAEEAKSFHDLIIGELTRLRICYEYSRKGKDYIEKVQFQEIHISPTEVFFKIKISEKGWFGWKNVLPRGVSVKKLIDEETLLNLTYSANRRVVCYATRNRGIWYGVKRLEAADGLPEMVPYSTFMEKYVEANRHNIPIPLGVRDGLTIAWLELTEYPHYLIAGSTKSGKSNLVNCFISTIARTQSPDDVRLVLVDMKEGVEFDKYRQLPHVMDVVESPVAFVETLRQVEEMRAERMHLLKTQGARDLSQYNRMVPDSQKLPRVVMFIDELAAKNLPDPRGSAKQNKQIAQMAENYLSQLLAKARAAGIHIVLSTQTGYRNLIPGRDHANIAVKISGRLGERESETVLGQGYRDAATLPPVNGRMVVRIGMDVYTIQTPYMHNGDIDDAIELAQEWPEPRPLALPDSDETQPIPMVTEQDVIAFSLQDYGGVISARRIWEDHVRDMGLVTFAELRETVNALTDKEVVEFKETRYMLKPYRKGKRLMVAEAAKT